MGQPECWMTNKKKNKAWNNFEKKSQYQKQTRGKTKERLLANILTDTHLKVT